MSLVAFGVMLPSTALWGDADVVAEQRAEPAEHVILLHGLARSSGSMSLLEERLRKAGYEVTSRDYPSRTAAIERLSEEAIGGALVTARAAGARRIHFVTHSLGGILVRSYLARHAVPELGRVVMLGPPNQGSELVDRLGGWSLFRQLNGPAGQQLGTSPDATPNALGPVNYPVGVIAGNRSINWINSLLIPGEDDGKVSVEKTKVAGMADHLVIAATHPFIMRNPEALRQTLLFLQAGHFDHDGGAGVAVGR